MNPIEVDPVKSLVFLAVFFPVTAAMASLAFMLIRRWHWLDIITPIFSLLSLLATLLLTVVYEKPVFLSFNRFNLQLVYIDSVSVYFMLLVNLVTFVVSWYFVSYLRYDKLHNPYHRPAFFHLLFNSFHVTMLVVPIMGNLILLWIAVELTTVVSTVLVRYRRDRRALEASWKFIIITTTGIIFALLGTLIVAYSISSVEGHGLDQTGWDPMSWSALVSPKIVGLLDKEYLRLAFVFILIGYGTKAGLAPMHTWLPDGHGEAPSPVSALLSGVMLKSALYAILRFYTLTNLVLDDQAKYTSSLLLLAGLTSLVLSTPLILKHNRFKRVLAYHSLEHMGIITFGLGIGTTAALFGALLHALNHAVTKALMFTTYGYTHQQYTDQILGHAKKTLEENDVSGVWKAMPATGSILAIGGLALVGSPPFNIFMSEFIILWAAVQKLLPTTGAAASLGVVGRRSAAAGTLDIPSLSNGVVQIFWSIAVLIFLASVSLIFVGMVRHLSRLLLGPAPFPSIESGLSNFRPLLPFLILLSLVALFGVWVPNVPWLLPLQEILQNSTQILMTGPLP